MGQVTSRARRSSRLLLSAVAVSVVGAVVQPARAATLLYWSGNGSTQGGVGTWDTTNARFGTAAAGPYTTVWNNANVDSVVLDSTPGAITTGSAITVNQITVNTATTSSATSWLIGNSTTATTNKITFTGANAGINTTYTTGTTFLRNAALGELVKTGPGRLELDNTGMGITKYTMKAGSITIPAVTRLGTAPGSVAADFFTFDGGGFGAAVAAADLGTTRGVTILAGGAFFGGSAATNLITVGAPVVGTAGGSLNVTNAGPFLTPINAGAILLLTNTANSYDGATNISTASTLRAGASNVIPNTSLVAMTGGTFDMATSSTSDTIKSISGTGTITLAATSTLTLNNPAGETATQTLNVAAGGKIVKNGAGALTLSGPAGNNNVTTGFRGEFVLNNGTLGVGTATMLGGSATPTATLTIAGGNLANPTNANINLNAALITNLNADFSVDDSLNAAAGGLTFNGGTQTIKNSDRTITVNGVASLILGGVVAEDAPGRSLTKAGGGVLALTNAANTYSGNTTVTGGLLQVDGDGSLGTGVGTLFLSGGAYNASASRSVATPNPVTLTANSAVTTTSAATTAVMDLGGSLGGSAGTLTFRNDGADSATDTFSARLSGNGYDFARPIVISNGATGKTELTGFNASGTQTLSGNISGNGGFARGVAALAPAGETILSGDNSFSGPTTINHGTLTAAASIGQALGGTSSVTILNSDGVLKLAAANQINDAATMTLSGGTFNTAGLSEGAAGTPGIGALSLSDSSIIDMGSAASILAFADSSAASWTTLTNLSIWNWTGDAINGGGLDELLVGTSSSGLTLAQLAQINFYSDAGVTAIGAGAQYVGTQGEVVPVPEPTAIGLLLLGATPVMARRRRR